MKPLCLVFSVSIFNLLVRRWVYVVTFGLFVEENKLDIDR